VVVSSALLYIATVCLILVGKRFLVVLSWGGSLSFSQLVGVLVGAGWLGLFCGYWTCDTVVFDYIPFSKFHTHNGDDTLPRFGC